ncbi:hypothetical protein [Bradyrhizobium sp. CW7]|uniref:hypothetical protein n=1 Tax=Bradyrhizobium sp. CW7 TaxID=2782688 RepID=UPI001FF80C9A|nr:hypothetical protein [Bradyrhizobium sp. CW7]
MHYVSTRGHSGRRQFCETLLEGLAEDGGLYVPETYPRVDAATLDAWRALSYPSLAFEVLSLYVSDIPPADLKAICEKTYTPEIFGTSSIVPLRKLETRLYLQRRTVLRWRSRTWPCSCSAICSSTNWHGGTTN